MSRVWRQGLGLGALVWCSCGSQGPDIDNSAVEACTATCNSLVVDCRLPTFPSEDSCIDGCLAGAREGADVESQQLCVELAECDLFVLVECDHDFGAP